MKITEIESSITEDQATQLKVVFADAFGTPPSESFLERLNEKKDLSILMAHSGDEIIGFKIGYTRFKGIFFSWLGAVLTEHRRQGVARELIRHQHKLCSMRGYKELQTESSGTKEGMLILNLKEGFEVYGFHLGHEDSPTVQLRKRLEQ